jgi:hypothetical protein
MQHREAASTATSNPDNIVQIEETRQLCTKYELRNILNMDETSLN